MNEIFNVIFDSKVHLFQALALLCDDLTVITGMVNSCYGQYYYRLITYIVFKQIK